MNKYIFLTLALCGSSVVSGSFALSNPNGVQVATPKRKLTKKPKNSLWHIESGSGGRTWVDETTGLSWRWHRFGCESESPSQVSWVRPSVQELKKAISHGPNTITESMKRRVIETRDSAPGGENSSAWHFYSYGGANSESFLKTPQDSAPSLCASLANDTSFKWVGSLLRY